jgi:hypothetical protein
MVKGFAPFPGSGDGNEQVFLDLALPDEVCHLSGTEAGFQRAVFNCGFPGDNACDGPVLLPVSLYGGIISYLWRYLAFISYGSVGTNVLLPFHLNFLVVNHSKPEPDKTCLTRDSPLGILQSGSTRIPQDSAICLLHH